MLLSLSLSPPPLSISNDLGAGTLVADGFGIHTVVAECTAC